MADSPDRIGPDMSPKKTFADRRRAILRSFTTKEGLIGDYDYAFLFRPNLPFMRNERRPAPFFGLNDKMPVFLALLLGFQHALAMLAGIITPPLILTAGTGIALSTELTEYLVSTSLIVCGFLSAIQISRFRILKTPYFVGTGLISVVGTSFATIPVAQKAFDLMYANGYCQVDAAGTRLPCPDAYGALLGTAACAALLEVLLSFTSPRLLKKIFPPLVTGPVVTLIGVSLVATGFRNWTGGTACSYLPTTGFFTTCPNVGAPHAGHWGSAQFIGLGFLVFVTIILCERFGSPIMKSTAVVIGLLVGCIVAAACGYFSSDDVDSAKAASFIWVHTFRLSVYGPLVLPFLAVYIVLAMEAIGDITATCDVSRLEVDGAEFDSRIQGGVLADGFNGILAALCTVTPMSVFAQNNGVIALTRCANRKAGLCACFWLVVAGIFSKFAGALVSIPDPVLGGMTTFLFASVAVSGIRIISTCHFTRRNRFILTCAFALGFGAVLVPDWFDYVFTYDGDNRSLRGFYDAIVLIMEESFAIAGFVSLILNLLLPEEIEDAEEAPSLTADKEDIEKDEEEWARIRGKSSEMRRSVGGRKSVDAKTKDEGFASSSSAAEDKA